MWSKIIRIWAGHGYTFFQGSDWGRLGSGKAGFNSFKFFAGFLQGASMAPDIDGQLERRLEAVKEQVDAIFGVKAGTLS